jgi:sensor histidine kinase YesM
MSAMTTLAPRTLSQALASGFRDLDWKKVLLLAVVNAAIALAMWSEDPRPYWHPLVTVQCFGFTIAYCVRVAAPWDHPTPIPRLVAAVAIGSVLSLALVILVKRYSYAYSVEHAKGFVATMFTGFVLGLLGSLMMLFRMSEQRAREELHRAETERYVLAKQAVEWELRLMQAQIEPHFLFNTLASVQYLTETDPSQASRLLGHLIAYLRAALPQLRSATTTLGREVELAAAYLNILRMRLGPRLDFKIDIPDALKSHPFPPVMLISVVENAVTHGIEPKAAGGRVTISAKREGERLRVSVTDTGDGLSGEARHGTGVGLANVRERLTALFGARARFTLEEAAPRGARATIEVPFDTAAVATAAPLAAPLA